MFRQLWISRSTWLLSPEPEIVADLNRMNMRRVFRMAGLLIALHAVHIALFLMKEETTAVARRWQQAIILSHSGMLFVAIIFFVISFPRGQITETRDRWTSYAGALLYLAFGALVAAIDQLVTPALTPLIITAIGIGAAILMPPLVSLPLYVAQVLIFSVLASLTQDSPEQLLSARVNAITVGFLGFGVNWIFYSARTREIRQLRTIARQRQDLAVRNRALRRVLAGRDRFFAIIAHDLRGPIGSVSDGLGILVTDYDEMDEGERKGLLRSLHVGAERSYHLLEDLLRWARGQTGQIPFRPEAFDLSELCREVFELVEARARRKSIEIHLDIPEGLVVHGDRSMIHSILSNLLGNALKFSGRGARVCLSALRANDRIEVSVTDSGIGLQPHELAAILSGETFSRSRGTEGEMGTGLGLVLTRQFLDRNGSHLFAENRPEGGSRFYFSLQSGSRE